MRQILLGRNMGLDFQRYVEESLRLIEQNSLLDNACTISDDFTVSNFEETRTLDAATATHEDLVNFVATFIRDLQNRGQHADR